MWYQNENVENILSSTEKSFRKLSPFFLQLLPKPSSVFSSHQQHALLHAFSMSETRKTEYNCVFYFHVSRVTCYDSFSYNSNFQASQKENQSNSTATKIQRNPAKMAEACKLRQRPMCHDVTFSSSISGLKLGR